MSIGIPGKIFCLLKFLPSGLLTTPVKTFTFLIQTRFQYKSLVSEFTVTKLNIQFLHINYVPMNIHYV